MPTAMGRLAGTMSHKKFPRKFTTRAPELLPEGSSAESNAPSTAAMSSQLAIAPTGPRIAPSTPNGLSKGEDGSSGPGFSELLATPTENAHTPAQATMRQGEDSNRPVGNSRIKKNMVKAKIDCSRYESHSAVKL